MKFLKSLINHWKKRHPTTLLKENKGHKTIRKSTPRDKPRQRKLQILSNHARSMPPREMKAQFARDGLSFETFKFEWKVKNDYKGVELEEKKYNYSVELEEKKWDHRIKLEEKNLDWENEEKEKDQSFEMAKLEQLASQEHNGKKKRLSDCKICPSS
ncbi:hypothetical protein VP01_6070g2 [Puccinia sorghi]|uniref:Uncharacterized protein n=1 Tax=Puccinia sorghi TaxID=27349 RepID=A0A0L6UH59_9BASI|nr:hypothetical protein VP01_6070g2 [Puccinia sorghi]